MQYIYIGGTELKALTVGLITGLIYGFFNLPIPAPNVLGGNLAILFTFIGIVIVGIIRKEVKFGKPDQSAVENTTIKA